MAIGTELVFIDPRYFRPTEVELLLGDPTKAERRLGWKATATLAELCGDMVRGDLELFRREQLLKNAGFAVKQQYE